MIDAAIDLDSVGGVEDEHGSLEVDHEEPDGAGRTTWLKGLELPETPDLPVHAIVAPSGQVTCMIRGAVEDSDYPAVAAFLGGEVGAARRTALTGGTPGHE